MNTRNIISVRLKQFRLARGLSLDELVAKAGGIVSKQAISKYERGLISPSPKVLTKIAAALDVKAANIFCAPQINVEFIAYRKGSGLSKGEQIKIQNLVHETLEKRIRLQDLLAQPNHFEIPIRGFKIKRMEDAEDAAADVRVKWNLGQDPICNVISVFEQNRIHVLEIDTKPSFDGISAFASTGQKICCAAVVIRRGVVGERQRLSLTHELGHLVLNVPDNLNEEKAAFRFGAALLAPKEVIFSEVGTHRSALRNEELLLLKKKFGMSMQALMYRLRELEVINETYYSAWFSFISKIGWRKEEPEIMPAEKPEWLKQNVLKAYAERIISHSEAESLLNEKIEDGKSLSLIKMRSFMKLPIEERRRLLAEQAEGMVSHYNSAKGELETGEFFEYGNS